MSYPDPDKLFIAGMYLELGTSQCTARFVCDKSGLVSDYGGSAVLLRACMR